MNPCSSHQLSLGDNPCFFSNISCLLLVLLVTDHHFQSLQLSSGKSIKPKETVILYAIRKEDRDLILKFIFTKARFQYATIFLIASNACIASSVFPSTASKIANAIRASS